VPSSTKKIMNIKILILLFVLLSSCATAQNKNSNKTEGELKELVNRMVEAQFNTHDKTILEEIYSDDFMEIIASGTVNNREKAINSYDSSDKSLRDRIKTEASANEFSIRIYDDFAIVITQVNVSIISDQQPPRTSNVRVTVFCRKKKNQWKIYSTQFTRIVSQEERPPIPPPPPPPKKKP